MTSFHFKRDLSNAEEMHKETPFEGCSSLKEYYLDYGVTRADWLPSAPALISINVPADHPLFTAIDGVLYSKDKRTLLRVPTGYAGEFILPRGVYTIAPNAFRNCSKITEVILPSSLQKIDTGAFLGCSSLRSVNFPGRLTEVGDKAFEGCTELARVHISSSVQRIGEGTFAGCPALRDISISPENKAYRLEGEKIMPACD